MFVITNSSGQYWNGECFGVLEAAERYEKVKDLPVYVYDDNDEQLHLEMWSDDDAAYYYEETMGDKACQEAGAWITGDWGV